MESLANFLRKHAAQLLPGDAEAITAAAASYEREGNPPSIAAELAVLEVLKDEQGNLRGIVDQVEAANGPVPDWVAPAMTDRPAPVPRAAAPDVLPPVAPPTVTAPARPPSGNKIFTDEAYAKAREVILRKLRGTLNTGFDPELAIDGFTAAGYHVENGARKFADYARAMVADFGDIIRPHLKGWYASILLSPVTAEFQDEMTPMAEVLTARFPMKQIVEVNQGPMRFRPWMDQTREHWKEFRPKGVAEMQANGTLERNLYAACEATSKQMDQLMDAGMDWHQAWELTRELFLFLPEETKTYY